MNLPNFPSLWNLPANPVLRRHVVARLRPLRLLLWVIISQVVTGFAWSMAVLVCLHFKAGDDTDVAFEIGTPQFHEMLDQHGKQAFLVGWVVILIIQAAVLLMKGTFSVATGVAREANEGMIEAQMLSPLPTGHKVLGQLLGLPVLESVVAVQLSVWAVLSAWLGELPLEMMARVYLILATSALFHHAMGLVAGTVIRQKILAGTLSQAIIILLHIVMPLLSGFGIGMFNHLGMASAILCEIASVPIAASGSAGIFGDFQPSHAVEFFRWEISVSGFEWVITVSALTTLVVILIRRWNAPDSQLLGKVGTTLLAAWILLLTCGELLPEFWRGEGVSREGSPISLQTSFADEGTVGQALAKAIVWIVGFAFLIGLLNLVLTSLLVPSVASRIRCAHLARSPWWSDGRNALLWVVWVSLMSCAAWFWSVDALLRDTPQLAGASLVAGDAVRFAASVVMPSCAFYALALWRGWGRALLTLFAVWLVPPMVAAIGLLMTARPDGWVMWIAGLSGLILPGYGALGGYAGQVKDSCQGPLHVSLVFHLLVTVLCLGKCHAMGRKSASR